MMNKLGFYMYNAMNAGKRKVREFFTKENGEVNIIAMVILIAIAVALAVLFRKEIGNLVSGLFKSISTDASNVNQAMTTKA